MRRFFINNEIAPGNVEVTGEEAYHMQRVLRLTVGDSCILVNHKNMCARAKVVASAKNRLVLQIETVTIHNPKEMRLTVLQGYLKERKLDDLIRPLSELGVAEFAAVFTARSVPSPDEKRLAARVERWQKLAIEAFKQCRGEELMQVGEVLSLPDALAGCAACDVKLFLWEGATQSLKDVLAEMATGEAKPANVVVLLGPEGGFSVDEAELAQKNGFVPVSLGARILRSQTAALAAAAIVQYVWGDLG